MTRNDGTAVSPLTTQQRRCLTELRDNGASFGLNPKALAAALATSPEGAAATASSLVVRGLATRKRVAGRVVYVAAGSGGAS